MRVIDYKNVMAHLKTGEFNYYNFYNADLDLSIFYSSQYYKNSKEVPPEKLPQVLNIGFLDIESYQQDRSIPFSFTEPLHPISAVSVYLSGTYYLFFLNINNVKINTLEWESDYHKKLVDTDYIRESDKIKIFVFDDEYTMLVDMWKLIREKDPVILAGWNSNAFDFPYIYKRMLAINNNDKKSVDAAISRVGSITTYEKEISIPDYSLVDLQILYMPRDDGGRNYGKKQASYSLNYISGEELNLQKFEYKNTNLDLNDFYDNDPKGYLFYNLIDTVLCFRLNEKLQHIELNNNIRRKTKCAFTRSLIGNSAVFESFILHENNYKHRFGVSKQHFKKISVDRLSTIPKFRTQAKNGAILEPIDIVAEDYIKYAQKFTGGYVRQATPSIINTGTVFSLDASSMYPNIMLQHNISFDTFAGRILSPTIHNSIRVFEKTLGTTNTPPTDIYKSVFTNVTDYIKRQKMEDAKDKEKLKRGKDSSRISIKELYPLLYFSMSYLLQHLYKPRIPLQNILNPTKTEEQILLSCYLIPFLDLLNIVHVKYRTYNDICRMHYFDSDNLEKTYPYAYVVLNAMSEKETIVKYTTSQLRTNIFNKYITTISGAFFLTHKDKLGLFTKLIEDLGVERKQYRTERDKYENDDLTQYQKYDNLQLSIKVLMNSIFGISGLKTFRASNFHLAHAITTQGQMIIRLTQHLSEKYLESIFD